MSDVNVETLAETENYIAWLSAEPDGEKVVHLELGAVTLHFFREEWIEVVELVEAAKQASGTSTGAAKGASAAKVSSNTRARDYLLALAKHLPPSAAVLRLGDVNGIAGPALAQVRGDLNAITVAADAEPWDLTPDSLDAVVAYNHPLGEGFLRGALNALRPGGRLIMVHSDGAPTQTVVQILEDAGYVRILVEPALADGDGVLMRGEKPHATDDMLERIQQVAVTDSAWADFATYAGRYVYLLIRQTPNKPVWALQPGESVRWDAVALSGEDGPGLLAFSGLPRAVGFMQPAVLQGKIKDVGKVARFSRETVRGWTVHVLLNPPVDVLDRHSLTLVLIDPATAEAAGE